MLEFRFDRIRLIKKYDVEQVEDSFLAIQVLKNISSTKITIPAGFGFSRKRFRANNTSSLVNNT